MKKKLTAVLGTAFLATCALGILTACGHAHTFADTFSYDETHHWYAANCEHKNEVKDKAEHVMSGDACTVCPYTVKNQTGSNLFEDESKPVTTLVYGNLRLQLLSDSLVRIESKGEKGFEDSELHRFQSHRLGR